MTLRKSRKSLRKDLPPEVLEIVFAFLPEHVVCRFRVVCKAWNHLILQPGFASLRALTPRQPSSIVISPKLMKRAPNRAWHILDVDENRSYKLPNDNFVWTSRQYKYTLAADGGLIYTMYSDVLRPIFSTRAPRIHIVCNPVSKSFHEIPQPEFYCSYNRDIVVMSVDNVTKAYKIITITHTFVSLYATSEISERSHIYLYDSKTSLWRKLCNAPIWGCGYRACSSVFVNDILYTLFLCCPNYEPPTFIIPSLYSCDLVTGAGSKIDVELPRLSNPPNPHIKLQLVVSLNRLFMVEYTKLVRRCRIEWVTLNIWEIVLMKGEVVKVANMREFCMLEELEEVMGEAVAAVGCANSIVISTLKGRCVKFDLSKKRWRELPTYTEENEYDSQSKGICTGLVDV